MNIRSISFRVVLSALFISSALCAVRPEWSTNLATDNRNIFIRSYIVPTLKIILGAACIAGAYLENKIALNGGFKNYISNFDPRGGTDALLYACRCFAPWIAGTGLIGSGLYDYYKQWIHFQNARASRQFVESVHQDVHELKKQKKKVRFNDQPQVRIIS